MLSQIACQESDVIDWERCLLGVDIETDRYLITLTRADTNTTLVGKLLLVLWRLEQALRLFESGLTQEWS